MIRIFYIEWISSLCSYFSTIAKGNFWLKADTMKGNSIAMRIGVRLRESDMFLLRIDTRHTGTHIDFKGVASGVHFCIIFIAD